MDFKRYDSFTSMAPLKEEWNQLLQDSASQVPFLTFEYSQAWWETRGGGEWPESSELILVAAFREDQLVGVAPLFHTENILGKKALMFIGSIEVSDFLDFIVQPKDLPEFLSGLMDFILTSEDIPQWDLFDLYNLLGESPTLAKLQTEAEHRGWTHEKIHLQPAPFIPLPGDYQTYLSNIDKKQRHEIKRKLRNVEQSSSEPRLYFVQNEDDLKAETQAFIDMMAEDPNKRDFLTEPMQQHLHYTAQTAFKYGWLKLAFLTLYGKKSAAIMAFWYQERLWLYNSGWKWEYREFSPGWVLLAYLIEWANQNGIKEFDFMRGNEAYKYKFGAVDRHIFRVSLVP